MKRAITVGLWLLLAVGPAHALDAQYAGWTALLKAHVVLVDGGDASRVDYAALKQQHDALEAVTRSLSAVSPSTYASWSKPAREAFLINAYNAFTVKLIVEHYPGLHSIKDLGGLLWFDTPWKQRFFTLLGQSHDLDEIEAMLRKPGAFDDPRIHFAINCASIGCPMLRPEAYTADRLDAQLDDQVTRFLSDHSRNRYANGRLEVSKIFDWYADDFTHGWHGIDSVRGFLGAHADALTDDPSARAKIRAGHVDIGFLPYDWSLNVIQH